MQRIHFVLKLLVLLAYNHRVSWPMANQNVIQKSFLKRTWSAIQLLAAS